MVGLSAAYRHVSGRIGTYWEWACSALPSRAAHCESCSPVRQLPETLSVWILLTVCASFLPSKPFLPSPAWLSSSPRVAGQTGEDPGVAVGPEASCAMQRSRRNLHRDSLLAERNGCVRVRVSLSTAHAYEVHTLGLQTPSPARVPAGRTRCFERRRRRQPPRQQRLDSLARPGHPRTAIRAAQQPSGAYPAQPPDTGASGRHGCRPPGSP